MKNIVDILGIVLPALIILLEFFRLFSSVQSGRRIKVINGLIMLLAIFLLLGGVIRYLFFTGGSVRNSQAKAIPLVVSKHSDLFNQSADSTLDAYFNMIEGFVNSDTVTINRYGTQLKQALDNFRIDELQKDTIIYMTALDPLANAKVEAGSIISDPDMNEKRGSLNILSDNLRNLLVIVKYDRAKIYWHECPVAFNDENPGNWLSRSLEVRNPYLGPQSKYEVGSKEYGGARDTINFTTPDTTQKVN